MFRTMKTSVEENLDRGKVNLPYRYEVGQGFVSGKAKEQKEYLQQLTKDFEDAIHMSIDTAEQRLAKVRKGFDHGYIQFQLL